MSAPPDYMQAVGDDGDYQGNSILQRRNMQQNTLNKTIDPLTGMPRNKKLTYASPEA